MVVQRLEDGEAGGEAVAGLVGSSSSSSFTVVVALVVVLLWGWRMTWGGG